VVDELRCPQQYDYRVVAQCLFGTWKLFVGENYKIRLISRWRGADSTGSKEDSETELAKHQIRHGSRRRFTQSANLKLFKIPLIKSLAPIKAVRETVASHNGQRAFVFSSKPSKHELRSCQLFVKWGFRCPHQERLINVWNRWATSRRLQSSRCHNLRKCGPFSCNDWAWQWFHR